MRSVAILLLLTAGPAIAEVGPTGGLVRQAPEGRAAKVMDGWEVGILALEPGGKGFWHFAAGQARAAGEQLTWGQGRLNFSVVGGKAGSFFAGAGTGLGWLDDAGGVRKKMWLHSIQAGVLLSPLRVIEFVWPSCPCFSCLFGRGNDCAACQQRKAGTKMMTSIRAGAEFGWRIGAAGLTGPEYRGWLGLVF